MSFAEILAATLPVYLTMLLGAVLRWTKLLPQEADKGIMSLCVRVLTPCLVLERIVGNPALNDAGQTLLAAATGFGLVAFGMLVCYSTALLIGLKRGEGSRTFALSTGLQNYGFVAIPVVEALFGKGPIGVMFTFTLGVELSLWIVGVGTLAGFGKAPWKHAINAPVISIITALILHYAGAGPHVPKMVHSLIAPLGACAVPLSVVLIGASIGDLVGTERIIKRVALASPLLRFGVLPFGFFLCARYLPVSADLKRILCVQGSMPSAVFSIVVARMYGGHPATAVQVVLATTLVSLVATPLLLVWGLRWVGL